ncbi:hypothetical protein M0805_006165 [Coniferiporia weirii]|nr:hypothetical protein M0805_006165 [Coniferiporia weirii]
MTPSPLHGLNIVQPDAPADRYANTDQQDLLTNPPFPDLAAQLDLWSNLTFQSDEPLLRRSNRHADDDSASPLGDIDKEDEADAEGPASLEGHVNAVNPTSVTNTQEAAQQLPHQFDMSAILAGFGIDPFLVPQVSAPQPTQAASLAQLLAAYPFAPPSLFGQVPGSSAAPAPTQQQAPRTAPEAPAARRQRSRKTSIIATPIPSAPSPAPSSNETELADGDGPTTPLSATEDKRRRNTAASARFRLKKKEREAALERRSRELETRVSELERECEALRRENGWLKGLVVGVTGAGAGAVPSAGTKRKREIEGSPEGAEAGGAVIAV